LIAGNGVKKLKKAGCMVQSGILENKGYMLNRRFFTFHNKRRPYIVLKWAETQDGFMVKKGCGSRWISNKLSRKLVHKWRSEEDAIMVGTNTAKLDNPKLNTRDWSGKDPVRIVIDRQRRLKDDLNIFDKKNLTLCYNTKLNDEKKNLIFIILFIIFVFLTKKSLPKADINLDLYLGELVMYSISKIKTLLFQ